MIVWQAQSDRVRDAANRHLSFIDQSGAKLTITFQSLAAAFNSNTRCT